MLAEFGGSLASLETEEGVKRRYSNSGFMSGRSMPVGPDRFDNSSRSLELLRTVLYWELRARIRLCFAALAALSNPQCWENERHEMLRIPQKLLYGFRRWQNYFTESNAKDELPVIPLFYSEYFAAYQALLVADENATSKLEGCAKLAKRNGFYLGLAQYYYLKKEFDIGLSNEEKHDYAAIQEYCGVNEQRMIAPLFKPGRAFVLSVHRYQPPIKEIQDANL
jgi:hypothetical protein